MLNKGIDKLELLRIVDAVANEKSIDKELVIASMESAIQKAALTKFGHDNNIEVKINRDTGEIKIQKVLEIVENVEDPGKEIQLKDVKPTDKKKPGSPEAVPPCSSLFVQNYPIFFNWFSDLGLCTWSYCNSY